jgi:hypothetical protein
MKSMIANVVAFAITLALSGCAARPTRTAAQTWPVCYIEFDRAGAVHEVGHCIHPERHSQ